MSSSILIPILVFVAFLLTLVLVFYKLYLERRQLDASIRLRKYEAELEMQKEELEAQFHITQLKMEAIHEREMKNPNRPLDKSNPEQFNMTDVFIVHGHDMEARAKAENFVRKQGLTPIILADQASGGKTIIEKLETYTDVGFGIVLYTPCDQTKKGKSRARQNVVLEHGYLMGKLGRNRVCALVKGDVETPSDINGVVYISMSDDWERQLVKELQAVGYPADANKI